MAESRLQLRQVVDQSSSAARGLSQTGERTESVGTRRYVLAVHQTQQRRNSAGLQSLVFTYTPYAR